MSEHKLVLKIDLEVAAQRMLSQIQVHNQELEAAMQRGIDKAVEEILTEDNFELAIKERVKEELLGLVKKSMLSWDIQKLIIDKVTARIVSRIDEFAEKVAGQIKL